VGGIEREGPGPLGSGEQGGALGPSFHIALAVLHRNQTTVLQKAINSPH
jgi:hypothetical protein